MSGALAGVVTESRRAREVAGGRRAVARAWYAHLFQGPRTDWGFHTTPGTLAACRSRGSVPSRSTGAPLRTTLRWRSLLQPAAAVGALPPHPARPLHTDPMIPVARCLPGEALPGDYLLGRHEVRGHPHHHGLKLQGRSRGRYGVGGETGTRRCLGKEGVEPKSSYKPADISRRGAMRSHPCECVENCVYPSTPVAAQERRLAHPQPVQTRAPLHHGTVGSAHTRRPLQRSLFFKPLASTLPRLDKVPEVFALGAPELPHVALELTLGLIAEAAQRHTHDHRSSDLLSPPRGSARGERSGAGGRRRGGRGAGWGGAEKWMIGRRHGGPSSRWL